MGLTQPDWTDRAACADAGTDLFFKGDAGIDDPFEPAYDYTEALQYCAGCTVRAACLASAIELRDTNGVRGGQTPQQIMRILRRGTGEPHGTVEVFRDGCRCNTCYDQVPHGSMSGHTSWGCKCDPCMTAFHTATRAARRPAKVAAPTG